MEKTIRIAQRSIVEEMRDMNIGDVVKFPLAKYKPTTVRSTPSASLCLEKAEGKNWSTRINYDDKCVDVTRIA